MNQQDIKINVRVKNNYPASYQNKIGTIVSIVSGYFRVNFDDGNYDEWNLKQADRFDLYIPDDCS